MTTKKQETTRRGGEAKIGKPAPEETPRDKHVEAIQGGAVMVPDGIDIMGSAKHADN